MRLQGVAVLVVDVLFWAVLAATACAFVNAAMQRPDAYTAADKLTKPVWMAILGAAALLSLVLAQLGTVIAAVAAGVYFVDVRPKLLEVQGKAR